MGDVTTLLDRALDARAPLLGDPELEAVRVFNGRADGIDGFVAEKFGPVCVVQWHEQRLRLAEEEARRLAEYLHRRLGTQAVYRKVFVRDRAHVPAGVAALHRERQPWIGEPVAPELVVRERGLRFIVRPYDGFSVGLFLEHRENRGRVRAMAGGRQVLNLFSYTGGFSVAAAAGGAAAVASVDVSGRALEWSRRNFEANGLPLEAHRFYRSEVFAFYRRARRQGHRYDLVVVDPPTFARVPHSRKVFACDEDLEALLSGAVELLEPGGMLLLATNDRGLTLPRLEGAVAQASPGRRAVILDRPPLPPDFAGDPDYARTVIARVD